jgi:uncharacterized RDD family membrane protein YckC
MVDPTRGPGDPEPQSGDDGAPTEGTGRFPDVAPEDAPAIPSTDWSGSPIPSDGGPEPSVPSDVPSAAASIPTAPAPPPAPVDWTPAPLVAPPAAWSDPTPPPPPVGWEVAAPVRREVAPGLVFASTGRRFVAYLIDTIIALLITWLIDIPLVLALGSSSNGGSILVATSIAAAGLTSFAYFALGWRSRARGTPGMRLLKLQIGNAFDGRTLTWDQAVRRWAAMGFPLYLLSIIPAVAGFVSLASLALAITLLITTIASQTKQGLHDRFANSAVVEPIGQGNGAIVGCVVLLVVVFVVLPVVSIVALIFLGGQVSSILSSVGSPPP